MRERPNELHAAPAEIVTSGARPALTPRTAAGLLALGAESGEARQCEDDHARAGPLLLDPASRSVRRGAATVTLLLLASAGLAGGHRVDFQRFVPNGEDAYGSVPGDHVRRGEPGMHGPQFADLEWTPNSGDDQMIQQSSIRIPNAPGAGLTARERHERWIPAAAIAASAAMALAALGADNHVMTLTTIGDYMTVPHSPSLAAHDALTVEFWVLFQNQAGFGRIGKSAPSDCQWGIGPVVAANASDFALCGPAIDANGFTVPTGRWVHVAGTWSQSTGTASAYIDGELVRRTDGGTAPLQATTYPVFIGMQPGYGASQLFGRIDNFRIWNVARTGQEINALRFTQLSPAEASSYPGLAASYTFENGASDSTGLNPGTLMGGASLVVDNSFLPNPCEGDIIGDGRVDGVDLAAVLAQWGQAGAGAYDADLNDDGTVNGVDLSMVLNGWGPCGG